jgi:hypothetical protein
MSPFPAAVPSFAALLSGGGGDVDPLAGIAYRLRFETHHGDKVLRPYFFQDVARTTPVVDEGDPVATMGPADAELVPEQATGASQGMYLLEADGTPYVDADGVDDWYALPSMAGPVTFCMLLNPRTWASYWSPIENSAANADHFGFLDGGGTTWMPTHAPASVRRDGVALAAPYNMAPLDEWAVWTVTTRSPAAALRGLFQTAQIYFGPLGVISMFIFDGVPSTEDRDAVEAFYESLKPEV